MLVPFSMIVLRTQLVMTVADDVPKFDIARGCLQAAKLAGQLPKQ
jgi:hypothetical protein